MNQPAGATQRRRRDGRPVEPDPTTPPPDPQPSPGQGANGLSEAVLGAGVVASAAGVVRVSGLPSAQAIALSSAVILQAFERFLEQRDRVVEGEMLDVLKLEFDDVPEDTRLSAVDEEIHFEKAYRAKVRARLDAKLPRVLQIADPARRQAELGKVLEAERRIAQQREEAMAVRALGNLEARIVESKSPGGGYWHLSPYVREHTIDCLAMGQRVWPWTVLRRFRPPLHVGCACELKTVQEARRLGLPGADVPMNPEAAFYAMQMPHDGGMRVHEAPVSDELEEELRILEARYDERYGAGTTLGGQFKPQRGARLGRPTGLRAHTRRRRGPRLDMPTHLEPAADPAGAAQSVTKKKAHELVVGDRVFTAGEWRKVEKVHEKTPGHVDLEGFGPVLLDAAREWDVQPAGVPGVGAGGRGGGQGARTDGLPELPPVGPTDRFALRYVQDAGLEMYDVENGKVEKAWPGEWDLDKVLADLHAANAAHASRTAPAPRHDIADAQQIEALGKLKAPAGATDLAPGIRFDPAADKMREQDGTLVLGQGFFRMRDRRLREKVILRHLGRRFAGELEHSDLEGLRGVGLGKASQIVDAVHMLNAPNAQRWHAEHVPQALALAPMLRARGYPLHPDVEHLVGNLEAGGPAGAGANRGLVDELRGRLVGMDDLAAMDAVQAGGWVIGGYETGPARMYVRHLGRDATLRISYGPDGRVAAVDELEHPTGEEAQRIASVARVGASRPTVETTAEADADPFLASTSIASEEGEWSVYTSPGGRAVAARYEAGKVVESKAVPALPDDVAMAKALLLKRDPVGQIRRGQALAEIRAALDGPRGGFRMKSPVPTPTHLPAGVVDVVDFEHSDRKRSFRLYLSKGGDQGLTVERVGYPDLVWPGVMRSQAEYHAQIDEQERAQRAARADAERRRLEGERQIETAVGEVVDAMRKDPKNALKAVPPGAKTNELVGSLRRAGWYLDSSSNVRTEGSPGSRYVLRSPQGETLTITGKRLYADQGVTVVKFDPSPQGGKRTRLPRGRAPKDKRELYIDALGRADEIGQRHDAGVYVTAIFDGGAGRGAAAVHNWGGAITMGNGKYLKLGKRLDDYLKRRKKGEALRDRDHLDFYDALSTLQHEINHGVAKRGDQEGGLSFGTKHYRKSRPEEMAMEEALTEETARILTLDWIRSYGMDDVLVAVKRQVESGRPGGRSSRIEGSYTEYRARLKQVFEDAGVDAEGEARGLLLRMKFEMTPEERMTFLDERLRRKRGADGGNTRHTMMRRANYVGPVYDDRLPEIDLPDRPGDGAREGDRVRVLNEPAVGQISAGTIVGVDLDGPVPRVLIRLESGEVIRRASRLLTLV